MNRIEDIFAQARRDGRTLLMPFITAGYPTLDAMPALIAAMQNAGASICEIGFPFSDPIADGPVIAASMHEALKSGVTNDRIFDAIAQLRPNTTLGLLAMVSYSIVHRYGDARFLDRCVASGFDGLIVPDLPLEESDDLRAQCAARHLTCSLLIAPTTDEARALAIANACTGFIYLLARTGITGETSSSATAKGSPENLEARVKAIRDPSKKGNCTTTPIACGFGISNALAVAEVTRFADAAIVGSAIVRKITEHKDDPPDVLAKKVVEPFVTQLATGLAKR